jgi:hypothetical protein
MARGYELLVTERSPRADGVVPEEHEGHEGHEDFDLEIGSWELGVDIIQRSALTVDADVPPPLDRLRARGDLV